MRLIGNGIWELFIPEIGFGEHYKFEITSLKSKITTAISMKSPIPMAFSRKLGLKPPPA